MSKEISDFYIMTFGKYLGYKIANVPSSYLLWLYENGKCYGDVKLYIEQNLDVLRKENKQSKWTKKRADECDATESDIY